MFEVALRKLITAVRLGGSESPTSETIQATVRTMRNSQHSKKGHSQPLEEEIIQHDIQSSSTMLADQKVAALMTVTGGGT